MIELLLLILAIFALVNALFTLSLWRSHKRLKQKYAILSESVERNVKDIAGLCSAALHVDSKLTDSYDQLQDIAEQVAEIPEYEEPSSQPYHSAIQKVRNGADAEELIQQCGLSREEAILLIRLHGNKSVV